jgi:hypothetical protein
MMAIVMFPQVMKRPSLLLEKKVNHPFYAENDLILSQKRIAAG